MYQGGLEVGDASDRAVRDSDRADFWDEKLSTAPVYSCESISAAVAVLAQSRKGIPNFHRGRVWKWLVGAELSRLAECPPPLADGSAPVRTYDELNSLPEDAPHVHDTVVEIDRDVDRTGVHEEEDLARLRRVLVAFAQRNLAVGYCQGLNFIVAELLQHTENEADAFWMLVLIVESLSPGTHCKTMIGLHVDQKVLDQLLAIHLPALHGHFQNLKLSMPFISTQWHIALFINSFPQDVVLRLWDVVFALAPTGSSATRVLFGAALAVFDFLVEELCGIDDPAAVLGVVNAFCSSKGGMDQENRDEFLLKAFQYMDKISPSELKDLRRIYRQEVYDETRMRQHKRKLLELQSATRFSIEQLEVLLHEFMGMLRRSEEQQEGERNRRQQHSAGTSAQEQEQEQDQDQDQDQDSAHDHDHDPLHSFEPPTHTRITLPEFNRILRRYSLFLPYLSSQDFFNCFGNSTQQDDRDNRDDRKVGGQSVKGGGAVQSLTFAEVMIGLSTLYHGSAQARANLLFCCYAHKKAVGASQQEQEQEQEQEQAWAADVDVPLASTGEGKSLYLGKQEMVEMVASLLQLRFGGEGVPPELIEKVRLQEQEQEQADGKQQREEKEQEQEQEQEQADGNQQREEEEREQDSAQTLDDSSTEVARAYVRTVFDRLDMDQDGTLSEWEWEQAVASDPFLMHCLELEADTDDDEDEDQVGGDTDKDEGENNDQEYQEREREGEEGDGGDQRKSHTNLENETNGGAEAIGDKADDWTDLGDKEFLDEAMDADKGDSVRPQPKRKSSRLRQIKRGSCSGSLRGSCTTPSRASGIYEAATSDTILLPLRSLQPKLVVTVFQARNLQDLQVFGSMDPYVRVRLLPSAGRGGDDRSNGEQRSSVVWSGGVAPEWTHGEHERRMVFELGEYYDQRPSHERKDGLGRASWSPTPRGRAAASHLLPMPTMPSLLLVEIYNDGVVQDERVGGCVVNLKKHISSRERKSRRRRNSKKVNKGGGGKQGEEQREYSDRDNADTSTNSDEGFTSDFDTDSSDSEDDSGSCSDFGESEDKTRWHKLDTGGEIELKLDYTGLLEGTLNLTMSPAHSPKGVRLPVESTVGNSAPVAKKIDRAGFEAQHDSSDRRREGKEDLGEGSGGGEDKEDDDAQGKEEFVSSPSLLFEGMGLGSSLGSIGLDGPTVLPVDDSAADCTPSHAHDGGPGESGEQSPLSYDPFADFSAYTSTTFAAFMGEGFGVEKQEDLDLGETSRSTAGPHELARRPTVAILSSSFDAKRRFSSSVELNDGDAFQSIEKKPGEPPQLVDKHRQEDQQKQQQQQQEQQEQNQQQQEDEEQQLKQTEAEEQCFESKKTDEDDQNMFYTERLSRFLSSPPPTTTAEDTITDEVSEDRTDANVVTTVESDMEGIKVKGSKDINAYVNAMMMPEDEWHPDEGTDACMNPSCSESFGIFVRRHHCRKCGLVFCDSCSLPRLFESVTMSENDLLSLNSGSDYVYVRLCEPCFTGLQQSDKVTDGRCNF